AVRVGLARVLLAQKKLTEVEDILEPVGVDGEIGAEAARLLAMLKLVRLAEGLPDEATLRARPDSAQNRYELGCVLAAKGESAGALEQLLTAGEKDYKLLTGPVREAMVQVFYQLGSDHSLANEYRSKLTQMLY